MRATTLLPLLPTLALSLSLSHTTLLVPQLTLARPSVTLTGSLIAANPTATTIFLASPVETLIYGPSTWNLAATFTEDGPPYTGSIDCTLDPTRAVCHGTDVWAENDPQTTVYDTVFEGKRTDIYAFVITAGEEKLTGTAMGQGSVRVATTKTSSGGIMKASVSPTGESWSLITKESSAVVAPVPTGAAGRNGVGLLGLVGGVVGGMLL